MYAQFSNEPFLLLPRWTTFGNPGPDEDKCCPYELAAVFSRPVHQVLVTKLGPVLGVFLIGVQRIRAARRAMSLSICDVVASSDEEAAHRQRDQVR